MRVSFCLSSFEFRLLPLRLGALCLLWALSACGGSGGGDGPDANPPVANPPGQPAPPLAAASAPTSPVAAAAVPLVSLRSESGDSIGSGLEYRYDLSNASIQLQTRGSLLSITVQGRESWTGEFQLPGNTGAVNVGSYPGLVRYPFQAAGQGAMSWSGEGRGCNTLAATATVRSAVYEGGVLRSLDLAFEQRCDSAAGLLRGEIRINATDMTRVTVPQNLASDRPEVRLVSDAGDYIGAGRIYTYDRSVASLRVSATGGQLSINVEGDESWGGSFVVPGGATRLAPGRYEGLGRGPLQSPGQGSLSWSGEGRGCNTLSGSFEIRSLRYAGDELRAIDMDFVQNCEGGAPALRGEIRWDADVPAPAWGPRSPVPGGLWAAPANLTALAGNSMYLESELGDFIGQGWTWRVGAAAGNGGGAGAPDPGETRGTVQVAITESAGLLRINLTGSVRWTAEFKATDGMNALQPGYYGIVQRYPFHNPARGGMAWSMEGRACNTLSGWFVVDNISYVDGRLQALELRFTQYCGGSVKPLRGWVRWNPGASASQ